MVDKLVLKDYLILRGILHCVTGLRIGASADIIEIGGLDNPIIKHPLTGMPYVPGSSLKGKMRALLELRHDKINPKNGDVHKPEKAGGYNCDGEKCVICRLFGSNAGEGILGPARLIVRDAYLTEKWENKNQTRLEEGLLVTEIKHENTINRVRASAIPRTMERIPAGVKFDFEIGYRIFDTGDDGTIDRSMFTYLLEGLRLVELDTLGGSGSRGYGKVSFKISSLKNFQDQELITDSVREQAEQNLLTVAELKNANLVS